MVVIYTQDKTLIRYNVDEAKDDLINLYGKKSGEEAYLCIRKAKAGTSFRKNGGPLVLVVSENKANWIREKEEKIGMLE